MRQGKDNVPMDAGEGPGFDLLEPGHPLGHATMVAVAIMARVVAGTRMPTASTEPGVIAGPRRPAVDELI